MHSYRVDLIHRSYDWDASLTFNAPDARTARRWALLKMNTPGQWLAVRAQRHKPGQVG